MDRLLNTQLIHDEKSNINTDLGNKIRTTFAGIHSLATLLEDLETDPGKKALINAISQSSQELLDYCSDLKEQVRL